MPRRRLRAPKPVIGFLCTAVLLLALEGAARWRYRDVWPHQFIHDPELGWVQRPGWSGMVKPGVLATFDAHGLREERTFGPKAGRRVLVLGDSVAFGYGLAQDRTIARVLESKRRDNHPDRPLEVINAGVPGYSTEQEVGLLARLAPVLEPDVVVLLYCTRNDMGAPPLDPAQSRELVPRSSLLRAVLDHSALAFAMARVANRRSAREEREQELEGGPAPFLTPVDVAELEPQARAGLFDQTRARLQAFRDTSLAHGAVPVLALCPEERLLDGTVAREDVLDPLLAIGAELGMATIDLSAALRSKEDAPQLMSRDGVHPTAHGARRIADALLAFLGGRGLL